MSHRFPRHIYFLLIPLYILVAAIPASSQTGVRVRGLVRDSLTRETVPFARVELVGADTRTLTDENGIFQTYVTRPFTEIAVSSPGYKPAKIKATFGEYFIIDISAEGLELGEVTVKKQKLRYSKKNNPALELMRKIRAGNDRTDPTLQPFYSYHTYQKIRLGANDFHAEKSGPVMKHFPFLKNHVDTSAFTGKPILPLVTREKTTEVYHRANPRDRREIVTGLSSEGLDEIADAESMRKFYEDILREIDIYDNDINILQNRFVSPLSRLAPDFYKYYLTDTTTVDGDTCIVLSFVPHNPFAFGFTGKLYVVKDDPDMFIKKVSMKVPATINLNYVKSLLVEQTFAKTPEGKRLKMSDDLVIEGEVIPGTPQVYAERHVDYRDHYFAPPVTDNPFEHKSASRILPEASTRPEEYWASARNGVRADNTGQMMEQMRGNKLFYWGEKIVRFLVNGYIPTGKESKFDFGPVNTLYSHNTLEGSRLRIGGMTTANLSRHFFLRGYGAYGFEDKKWKYNAEAEYSFRPKKYHPNEFPIHSIAFQYLYDIDKIGQHFMYADPDNVFLSITRHEDRMIAYQRVARLRYTLELENNFSVTAKVGWKRLEPSRVLPFLDGWGNLVTRYDESSVSVTLRYAPGEKFYQGRMHRYPINLDAPVISVTHTWAPGWFPGNRYQVNVTEASVGKRWWFSAWGYLDMLVKGGHVWSRSAFPDLLIPNANLSYTVQPESFALMNPMEFVNDSYASWDLTYWANGAIFNYIPYLRKLRLREVFSFRGIWGHLSDRNNPSLHPSLLRFPSYGYTRKMSDTPYMEVAVGLDNILTFLRFDYVWRLTYRDTPGVSRSGFQVAFHMTF